MSSSTDHPSFDNPPVVEVVCGVQFQTLDRLLAGHIGTFWDKVRDDYPICHDHPPLAPVIEQFEPPKGVGFEVSNVPPLPRTWFEHKNKTGIIQLQRDRFHHNWRKVGSEHEYPRYEEVIQLFKRSLESFEVFLHDNELGELKPTQYELTYVNHIPSGRGWESFADLSQLFPDFSWRLGEERFLPNPEAVNWKTAFRLPDNAGRLHVTMRLSPALPSADEIFVLEITARGFTPGSGREEMWKWFDNAHSWIVRGIQSASSLRPDDIHERIREQREIKRFAELVHGWFRRSAAKSVCTWRVSEESPDASAATLDLIRALNWYDDDSAEGGVVAVKYEHKILFSHPVNITKLPRLQPRIADYEESADEHDE